MEVEIQNSKEDYYSFFRYYIFQRKIALRIIVVVYISLLGMMHESGVPIDWPILLLRVLIFFTIAFSTFFLLPYLITFIRYKKLFVKKGWLLDKQKIILGNDGFQVESVSENNIWKYNAIRFAGLGKDFIFIFLLNSDLYLIPKRFFRSENEAVNFFGQINAETLKFKGNSRDPRRLYYWGFLGVWPGVGAVTGIILLLRGLLQYKDKWLTIIGAACILFNAMFFFIIFYNINFSKEFRNRNKEMARMELNGLVKDLEFYKVQNGVYPDSLVQVTKDNKCMNIYDPFLLNFRGKSTYFHYQKIGNKYTLFSVGVDGIPYTKDDIYPNLVIKDSSKFGLIKVDNAQ